jgi:hypothetical protein
MRRFQLQALTLVVILVWPSVVAGIQVIDPGQQRVPTRSEQVRTAIDSLQGQYVKIKLVSKKTHEGLIHRPTAEGFELITDKKAIPVIYADVTEVFHQFPGSGSSRRRTIGRVAIGVGTAVLIHLVCKGRTGCLL